MLVDEYYKIKPSSLNTYNIIEIISRCTSMLWPKYTICHICNI